MIRNELALLRKKLVDFLPRTLKYAWALMGFKQDFIRITCRSEDILF
jgi:hypothetical protein